jgi:hypothetical protein
MSVKTKTITTPEKALALAQQAGIILMTAAVTLGMTETSNRTNARIIVPNQPSFAMATEQDEQNNNVLRRESEESEKSYVSYSVTQRTPARSGRR